MTTPVSKEGLEQLIRQCDETICSNDSETATLSTGYSAGIGDAVTACKAPVRSPVSAERGFKAR
jgi:hypothetical protein